ncbi:MAG: AraC family transcriptional regulator, partial [Ignavibacteria bacterium]|nr:AraC family transcriptional regulator [Ignavibacteria bacterium]
MNSEMESIYKFETISDLVNQMGQGKAKHPLVAVIDFSKVESYGKQSAKMKSGFYSMMLKNHCYGNIIYGREYYDFQEGS